MTVNEFVTKMETNVEQLDEALQVRAYLPVEAKKAIVAEVINESLLYEDEIYKFDGIKQFAALIMAAVEAYTAIEVSDDYLADFDTLCASGLLKDVMDRFAGEYEMLRAFLQMECDNIMLANTVESKVGTFLSDLSDKIDDVFEGASSLFAKVNKEDVMDLLKGLRA